MRTRGLPRTDSQIPRGHHSRQTDFRGGRNPLRHLVSAKKRRFERQVPTPSTTRRSFEALRTRRLGANLSSIRARSSRLDPRSVDELGSTAAWILAGQHASPPDWPSSIYRRVSHPHGGLMGIRHFPVSTLSSGFGTVSAKAGLSAKSAHRGGLAVCRACTAVGVEEQVRLLHSIRL